DGRTNCPVTGPRSLHAIIIDRSDPISGQQAQRLRQLVSTWKSEAEFALRFDVYTVEGDASNVVEPVLQICSPGKPDNVNPIYQNPDRVRKRFEESFSAVLDRTVEQLLKESTRSSSPIIESTKAAALSSFGPFSGFKTPLQ